MRAALSIIRAEICDVFVNVAFARTATIVTMFAVAAIALIVLTGCTTTTVEFRQTLLADRIPASLLTCKPRPERRPLPMQSDAAKLLVETDGARADCERKLGSVRELVAADAVANLKTETE